MDKSILKTIPLPVIQETRAFNIINGNDAELLSASSFLMACGAEISWGSRNEDGRKIDLIVSFDHPWFEKERLLILIQVKSGATYGKIEKDGFTLYKNAKILAQRTSHSICILWVDRKSNSIYWAYVYPKAHIVDQKYGKHHLISPAVRYDLARAQATLLPCKTGGKGVIICMKDYPINVKRKNVHDIYRHFSTKKIINPLLGEIEFTNIGWRHMFRKSRRKRYKSSSLDVIPQLCSILEQKPSDFYISSMQFSTQSSFEYRSSEYVTKFDDVKIYDAAKKTTETISVVIRLCEEIRYPSEWKSKATLSQQLTRRVVLRSCYHKKK